MVMCYIYNVGRAARRLAAAAPFTATGARGLSELQEDDTDFTVDTCNIAKKI
jgi:hypothetical protein